MAAAFFTDADAQRGMIDQAGFAGVLFGDPVDTDSVDWDQLLTGFRRGDFSEVRNIRGVFSLALYDVERKRLYLVTDKLGMQPVHYAQRGREIVFSSALPTFVRLGQTEIDQRWVSEFIFFNYPLGSRTFLRGVTRLPAGTVAEFDIVSNEVRLTRYSLPLGSSGAVLCGSRAVDAAFAVFEQRVPGLIDESTRNWVTITAGLDSKTAAVFVPDGLQNRTRMYTYGRPSCRDMLEGQRAADEYRFSHQSIELDAEFEKCLMDLMEETVWLSGGLQKMNRAHLCFSYARLAVVAEPFPVVLSGISGDHVFRDHPKSLGNVPHIIAPEVSAYINRRTRDIDTHAVSRALRAQSNDTEDYLQAAFSHLIATYGDPTDPVGYFSYLMYVAGPKYFGAELALAQNFVRLRTPFWEEDLLQLAYDIDCSTIGLSIRYPERDRFRETQAQANIILRASRGRRITHHGLPIKCFARGNRFSYEFYRLGNRGVECLYRWLRGQTITKIENWNRWLEPVARRLGAPYASSALVHDYVTDEYIHAAVQRHDLHTLAKLYSLAITLDMVNNGWSRRLTDADVAISS
jgi:asparagine synthetase B (glutamine-hydrolysing)